MRNISFALTTAQVRHGFATGEIRKDVTRRLGWRTAQPGEQLCACEKCQGLGKGGKLVRLGTIALVTVRFEPLRRLTDDLDYGFAEIRREGFADDPVRCWPSAWVDGFCSGHKHCTPDTVVTRLEFRYLSAWPAS